MASKSLYAFYLSAAIILIVHFLYYPKWQKPYTEATLSWDVSGYYMYLPALFIYNDLKTCSFRDDILEKYRPTPNFQQGFFHEESGNCVMKYPAGMALQYLPFFGIAHAWASWSSKYPADGFSLPYQLLISIGTLFIAILGLYFIRKSLLIYFSEGVTALTMLLVVLGSNYLNYSAIDGAMTHNYLFTLYAILIYQTILFYQRPGFFRGMAIGSLVGLCALTRPTEIISVLIPLLWGVNLLSTSSWLNRLKLIQRNIGMFLSAVVACGIIGSIQLIYWKYVSGDWLVYSYEDQGFSWHKPRIWRGFFSYKAGWITYSPVMIFSVIGFYCLWNFKREIFLSAFLFFLAFIYIAFSWDVWWYGGSLGQRTMVQTYPILMFPFAAFISTLLNWSVVKKTISSIFLILFSLVSLWFTHQAHLGGLFYTEQMTQEYYWATLGRFNPPSEVLKYLDTDELFKGEIGRSDTLFYDLGEWRHIKGREFVEIHIDPSEIKEMEWLRISANWKIGEKEWNFWDKTQIAGSFKSGEEVVKKRFLRLQRFLDPYAENEIFFDIKFPKGEFDSITVTIINNYTPQFIDYKNLMITAFSSK